MTLKPVPTSGRFKVTSSIVIAMNLEFQLSVPKEETFPVPLTYIDVTNLDVVQEKRVDDYWNVDSNSSLSESWKGFTKFTLVKEEPPKEFLWSGVTKVHTTTRPDHVCHKYGRKLVKPLGIEKNKMEKREAKTRECSKTERILLYSS